MNIHRILGFFGICLLMAVPSLMEAATPASTRYCPNGYYAYREKVTQAKPSCLNAADFFQKKKDLQNSNMDYPAYKEKSAQFSQTEMEFTLAAKKLNITVDDPTAAETSQQTEVPQQCTQQSCDPDYHWNGISCACVCTTKACQSPQQWNPGTCKCETPAVNTAIPVDQNDLQDKFAWDHKMCIHSNVTDGIVQWNNGKCDTKRCVGVVMGGEIIPVTEPCIKPPKKCDPGQVLSGADCVRECPSDGRPDPADKAHSCVCIGAVPNPNGTGSIRPVYDPVTNTCGAPKKNSSSSSSSGGSCSQVNIFSCKQQGRPIDPVTCDCPLPEGASSSSSGDNNGCIAPAVMNQTNRSRCWCDTVPGFALDKGDTSCRDKTGVNAKPCTQINQISVFQGFTLCTCNAPIEGLAMQLSPQGMYPDGTQYCLAKVTASSSSSSSSGGQTCSAEITKSCALKGYPLDPKTCTCAPTNSSSSSSSSSSSGSSSGSNKCVPLPCAASMTFNLDTCTCELPVLPNCTEGQEVTYLPLNCNCQPPKSLDTGRNFKTICTATHKKDSSSGGGSSSSTSSSSSSGGKSSSGSGSGSGGSCPSGQELNNGVCQCTNGTSNPPACTTCPVGMKLCKGVCQSPSSSMCSGSSGSSSGGGACPYNQVHVNGGQCGCPDGQEFIAQLGQNYCYQKCDGGVRSNDRPYICLTCYSSVTYNTNMIL